MRIAVTGAGGGLGRALLEHGAAGHEVFPFTHRELEVREQEEVRARLGRVRPDVILHLAAMTSVDGCELDPEGAYLSNAIGTFNVAHAAREVGALLVAMSTDYVFDGAKEQPYEETDRPAPLSVYGRSKLAAEQLARATASEHLVVRTSWVFGAGEDFVSHSVRRLAAGDAVGGIVDQVGTPTYVVHLAERILPVVESGLRGTVHLAGPEPTTWYDVLRRAKDLGGLPGEVVEQKADELDRPAPRPPNSALASVVLPRSDVPSMPPLDDAIAEVVERVVG